MEKKFTFYLKTVIYTVLTLSALIIASFTAKTYAQLACQSEAILFPQNFGTGTTPTSDPDILPTGLTYQSVGWLSGEGIYRVIDSTNQKPEWQVSGDHTGNLHGKMLVINGQAETFYSHRVDAEAGHGFQPADYIASMFIMNVNTVGTCAPTPLLPTITIRFEYLAADGTTWVPLIGSPYIAAPIAQSPNPTWVELGSFFTLPSTGGFEVKSMRMILSDGTIGGCGNDFALDDIKVSFCANRAAPVQFLGITARQKGSGVNVEWSTAQELNSKSFVIEKSANGNSNWSAIATVNGAGNSSIVKKYSVYDPQPFNGVNFYRIKQVDIDGHFMYSNTVSLKLSFIKTGVSVLTNPFQNSLTVDFSSLTDQGVTARLIDITGKQVAFEKWSINAGSTRKNFSGVNGLQRGTYILTVSNTAGEILYNNKVIKQ